MTSLFAANMNVTWWLIPLIISVSLVYNATRYEAKERILRRSLVMGTYILAFMGGALVLLFLVS